MKGLFKFICRVLAVGFFFSGIGYSQESENRSLLDIIHEIEKNSDLRFLYREALVSNIKVRVSNTESLNFDELEMELRKYNIGLQIDEDRNQALIFRSVQNSIQNKVSISGFVVDNKSGDRLPYSTISWYEAGEIKGIAASSSGTFSTNIASSDKELSVLFSFVGYEPKKVNFDLSKNRIWNDIAIRLEPALFGGKEIVVNGSALFSPSDTVYSNLLEAGAFSPLGDDNVIQALKTLPSVISGPAMEDGLNVRGSSSDGFRISLDGLTLYNQSHLFGLLDGLNGDVLRSSGFFYDITPAQYKAPLGGTLSFITKTGNLQNFNASAGLSNTAAGLTLEGPIKVGKSSFLVSGRHSYIGDIDWLNNNSIIEYGLDINRDYSFIEDTVNKQPDRVFRGLETDADFYDVHAKVYTELQNGSRLILSSYLGKDDAYQRYERRTGQRQTEEFITENDWSNKMFNLAYSSHIGQNTISETTIGFSDYFSSFFKEDHSIQRTEQNDGARNNTIEIIPLSLENELTEFHINQSFEQQLENFHISYGLSYSDFEVGYVELGSGDRSFRSRRTGQLFDTFFQVNFNRVKEAHLNIGSRTHYFSNGRYLDWSPRIKLQLFPENKVSAGLGYSRNHQFLHRLEFISINSTDFWIMSNEDQPPSSVNYYTTNIKLRPTNSFYFQAEAYYKVYENLRLHGLSDVVISSSFEGEDIPFLFDNKGMSKGVEFLAKTHFNKASISATYTLSSAELENISLNDGDPFYATYDRTHQFSVITDINLSRNWTLFSSWSYATGTPGSLLSIRDLNNGDDPERLGDYSRVDTSVKYQLINGNEKKAVILFSIYNLFNRNNPWYSTGRVGQSTNTNRAAVGFAEVYDLGIQPSFKVKFFF